jgi:CHAT domain-containing protein/tetratricopeptide (TPR) repeat protein
MHRKDFDGAERFFREALAGARSQRLRPLEASAVGSLGLVRILTGRYDEATGWLRQALTLSTAIHADIPRAKTLQNLGWCYYKLGDFDRALPLLLEAEVLTARTHLTADRLQAITNLGNCFYRKGELGRAGEEYARALAVAREIDDRVMVGQLLSNLGVIAYEQARHDQAESLLGEALAAKIALGDQAGRLKTLVNQGHVWAARGAAGKAEAAYRQALASAEDPELVWEARSGLAVLHVKAGRAAFAEAEFRAAFAVMESSRDRLHVTEHRIAFFSSLRRFHDEHVDFLVGAGRSDEALVVADRGRARLLSESLQPHEGEGSEQAARYRQLAGALDAVLLFYWTGPRRTFLWAVVPSGPHAPAGEIALRILPGEAEIAQRVEAHQARIQRARDPVAEKAPEAQWLYRTLVGPVADRIPSGKRVILVPDGALHQLNFETLVVPGPTPHYWIEDVTLATAPSLGLLVAGTAPARGDRSILVVGDPISPGEEFPHLPHAAREVARISELFGPARATVRAQAEAVPAAYAAAQPGRFAFIHFAAHATANRESPLESAVILSARDDSYKLYARDIVAVPLDAELVTLSACRSAGSRAYAGEGLVGLAWAFLGSGARNVIGGLWNIEDASTADLMEQLYRSIEDGLDPLAALRAAKLRLLRSDTAHRKPYYWAPFVAYTRGS